MRRPSWDETEQRERMAAALSRDPQPEPNYTAVLVMFAALIVAVVFALLLLTDWLTSG